MSHSLNHVPLSRSQLPLFMGIDVGGTNIKFGLVDDLGQTVGFSTCHTEVEKGPDHGVALMTKSIHELISQTGVSPTNVVRVGLATPGTMDIPAGKLLMPHNLSTYQNCPIRDKLAEACQMSVSFDNDANAAAYGEYWVGRGKDYRSMVLLTLGTGVGGGIIIDGNVVRGENSHGAECGHLIIDLREDARKCMCGQPGHLEGYASATAVVLRTHEALQAGAASSLRHPWQDGEDITAKLLYDHAKQGDPFSLNIILDTAMYLGVGITTLLHVIDPNAVVLAGAMDFGGADDEIGAKFLERIRAEVRKRAFPVLSERTAIDFASLGADAGYLGAAGIARADHLST
jgi:glucokinase